jgi:hypothetical protein
MTPTHRSRPTSRLIPCLALLALLALLASSCASLTTSQVAVSNALDDYDVGPDRPPTTETDTGFRGPTVQDAPPHMTIATLTLKPGRPRGTRQLMALIKSDEAYAPMGIAEGENVVWRDTWDSTAVAAERWINVVTPRKRGKPDHTLRRDPRRDRYPALSVPHQPRLIVLSVRSFALIACLDDPSCGTGHCGHY